MKNKLIMHTKLHLQETLRCVSQSSKMISFPFCSRGRAAPLPRLIANCKSVSTAHALLAALHGDSHGHHHRGSNLGSRPPGAPYWRGARGLR